MPPSVASRTSTSTPGSSRTRAHRAKTSSSGKGYRSGGNTCPRPARLAARSRSRRAVRSSTVASRNMNSCSHRRDEARQRIRPARTVRLDCLFVTGHHGRVSTAVSVPQEERTRAMRQRLLDATVECLVEFGWSGTSTTLVSQRAGVSRGAQLHHFPTKADLVLAAVEHLSDARREELRAAATDLPTGRRRTRAVLEMLATHFT